ncbi:MAG TPA: F0F1 ATP synthase subunit epsilon [Candidatus Paceibacterota bacterium]|nr:F0F1 ATP synthase subunit epsilon [Candidatus Paceibacterota bacterium]HMO83047.1 F0F1 ATP synthase subunit epsilon [Candidatus Paceibacterota bacterium]
MATQKLLKLTISKVNGPVFDDEVVSVTVPGSEGEMTLLADHAPIVSVLKTGLITVRLVDGTKQEFGVVESGTLEVSYNTVTILL